MSQKYSYSADKSEFTGIAAGFVLLIVAEGIIFELLLFFVLQGWLKFVATGAMISIHLLLVAWILSPLFTRHELTTTHLRLRYGWYWRANVPLEFLVAAQPVSLKLEMPMPALPFYKPDKQRFGAAFSQQGQVLLYLDRAQLVPVNAFQRKPVERILINIDQRDDFLAVLNLPGVPGPLVTV